MQSKTPKAASQTGRGDIATVRAASDVLSGETKKGFLGRILPFLGPAFIACVAYIDPGNFATNIQGGASFGYLLDWLSITLPHSFTLGRNLNLYSNIYYSGTGTLRLSTHGGSHYGPGWCHCNLLRGRNVPGSS